MNKSFGVAIVGLAGVVAQAVAFPHILKVGTCASGNTPYVIANQCPSGTGTWALLIGGGMTLTILCMVFAGFLGGGLFGGAGLILWAGEFLGLGVVLLLYSLLGHDVSNGGKLGGVIIGIVFIPMGGIPLLFGIRSWLSDARESVVKHRMIIAEGTIARVDELKRYGANQAHVRITYTVHSPDGDNFEVSRETNAIISHMPRPGSRVKLSYDPHNLEHVTVLSSGAGPPTSARPAARAPSPATVPIPGIPGDTGTLPWVSSLTPSPSPSPLPGSASASASASGAKGDPIGKLQQLSDLHDRGALTDSEFAMEKAKLLAET